MKRRAPRNEDGGRAAGRGISCCFLGSAQPDASAEAAALAGRCAVVYCCPETVERLLPQFAVRVRGVCARARVCLDRACASVRFGGRLVRQRGRPG